MVRQPGAAGPLPLKSNNGEGLREAGKPSPTSPAEPAREIAAEPSTQGRLSRIGLALGARISEIAGASQNPATGLGTPPRGDTRPLLKSPATISHSLFATDFASRPRSPLFVGTGNAVSPRTEASRIFGEKMRDRPVSRALAAGSPLPPPVACPVSLAPGSGLPPLACPPRRPGRSPGAFAVFPNT
jgi:hypothetical protein